MYSFMELIDSLKNQGYNETNAEARVCQDLVLKAISQSSLSQNVTIKGGVVMRNLTENVRRATQDLDIDFIKYPLEDIAIKRFVSMLNNLEGVSLKISGQIEDLKQQDYHGKRVYIEVIDTEHHVIRSKIDFGVHNKMELEQEEYCFDVCFFDDGVNLLINSKEQMLAEKLRSLLKFGPFSTRYKDIFDICYLMDLVDYVLLEKCMKTVIFDDSSMKENNMSEVLKRIKQTFSNKQYKSQLSTTDKNWLNLDIEKVLSTILIFFEKIS